MCIPCVACCGACRILSSDSQQLTLLASSELGWAQRPWRWRQFLFSGPDGRLKDPNIFGFPFIWAEYSGCSVGFELRSQAVHASSGSAWSHHPGSDPCCSCSGRREQPDAELSCSLVGQAGLASLSDSMFQCQVRVEVGHEVREAYHDKHGYRHHDPCFSSCC